MSGWQYTRGLHDLGNGAWAYLQPDGGWGWSNAGIVTDGEASLLVDTLFDEVLTAEMLGVMRDGVGAAADQIDILVNTHANGDHTFGNRLVGDARIIASEASAREMEALPPAALAGMQKAAAEMGEAGAYFTEIFGAFHFEGIPHTPPSETFSGKLSVQVGDTRVELVEVGPAHTEGDVLVHVPERRVLYTGDILFIDGTPIIWAGPVGNWLRACDWICQQDVDTIVPGHGPITDKAGVRRVGDYLSFIDSEARKRFDAGMAASEAARDIGLGDFGAWGDAERIAVNVHTLYREYGSTAPEPGIAELFALMAELRRR
jgi:glyoxylase-like metal-dependent hydrolase (beta-lactamase superfamily II)